MLIRAIYGGSSGHSHLKKVSHKLHQLTLIVIETEIECHEF
jgi:hypothetical protein